jgi:peptidoglycan hydrolase-like protein with peptidoglycan-binding domain
METADVASYVTAFEATGNTYLDVQRALIELNEFDGSVVSFRSPIVEEAIRAAEARRGLRVDGDPDQTLLASLLKDLAGKASRSDAAISGQDAQTGDVLATRSWLDSLVDVSTILGAIGTFLCGLAYWRPSRKARAVGEG